MPPYLSDLLKSAGREAWKLWLFTFDAIRRLWAVARGPIVFALNILAALIVLFEEWGWRPLAALLASLAKFRLIARLEAWIATLPPYGALLVFALPTTILLPVKLAGLWLLAKGAVLTAGGMLVAAKIVSTALVARIFTLTKPALMQLSWFASVYHWFVPWKEHLFGIIRASWAWRYGRMVKTRVKLEVKQAWVRWKPAVTSVLEKIKPRLREMLARLKEQAGAMWQRVFGSR